MAEPNRRTEPAGVTTLVPTRGGQAQPSSPDVSLVVPLHNERASLALLAPIVVMALMSAGLGFASAPVYEIAREAADELMDSSVYINAVLPEGDPLLAESATAIGDGEVPTEPEAETPIEPEVTP